MDTMKLESTALYWPMAITDDGEKLFTTDAAFSVDECFEQFDIWANHYHCNIKEAWIDTYTDEGKARHNCSRVWKIDDVVFTQNPS